MNSWNNLWVILNKQKRALRKSMYRIPTAIEWRMYIHTWLCVEGWKLVHWGVVLQCLAQREWKILLSFKSPFMSNIMLYLIFKVFVQWTKILLYTPTTNCSDQNSHSGGREGGWSIKSLANFIHLVFSCPNLNFGCDSKNMCSFW